MSDEPGVEPKKIFCFSRIRRSKVPSPSRERAKGEGAFAMLVTLTSLLIPSREKNHRGVKSALIHFMVKSVTRGVSAFC
jgi:hypothetical protein